MSDLEDVKEDLDRICAEGDVLCCAALKCIRELEAALSNIDDLNQTQPDENGHTWAVSDLINQEIVATRYRILAPAPVTDETRKEINELREIVADLIQGARRDRSLLSRKAGPLHVIDTSVTKGQVLRAIRALAGQGGA